MFSVVSVYMFTGVPQVTITHDSLDLTVLDPMALALPPDMGPHWIGTPPPASDIWWPSLVQAALSLSAYTQYK